MYPLQNIPDLDSYKPSQMVGNYWRLKNELSGKDAKMGMKVYLSTNHQFTRDFLIDEFVQKGKDVENLPMKQSKRHDNILLWEEPSISSSSLSKTFILTSDDVDTDTSPSFQFAKDWLDELDRKDEALAGGSGISSVLTNAGEGIESTSVLLSIYNGISNAISKLVKNDDDEKKQLAKEQLKIKKRKREVVNIPVKSSIWKSFMTNSTVNIRVLITREGKSDESFESTMNNLMRDEKAHDLLVDGVDLVKFDIPYHIERAKRYLYKDVLFLIQKYILRNIDTGASPPWDMSVTKPTEFKLHEMSLKMKDRGMGYPYWKPELAVKLVSEEEKYPLDFVQYSQMDVIHVERHRAGRKPFESGYAYLPGLHVDEMGLTSEKYIPLNETVEALPLRVSFDSGENDDSNSGNLSSGGLSPGRWRLLKHLAKSIEGQKELGFEQSDIDDVKRLIADTNVTLLLITVMASVLHLLFEFLTFKNDVEFWRGNKDLTGLSVRALFMDFFSQTIILLYLIEKDSSLLMTIPAACGCLIALWKAQRGSGLKFVKATEENTMFFNKILRIVGVELQATRLRAAKQSKTKIGDKKSTSKDLAALSEETDQLATRLLGKYLMLPLVLAYTCHTLVNEEHSGWYSWFITSASSAMYGLGFVFMTPQLFLNYKLKSVAHLPWKVLGYRFVNTFIDDLFAFIIRMPTMARISCFRDDIVFIIYLWQRYLYPVDTSRPIEGGGMDAISAAAQTAVIEDEDKESETKKNQ